MEMPLTETVGKILLYTDVIVDSGKPHKQNNILAMKNLANG